MNNNLVRYTIKLRANCIKLNTSPIGRFISRLIDDIIIYSNRVAYIRKVRSVYQPGVDYDIEIMDDDDDIDAILEERNGYWSETEVQDFLMAFPELRYFVEIEKNTGWVLVNVDELLSN